MYKRYDKTSLVEYRATRIINFSCENHFFYFLNYLRGLLRPFFVLLIAAIFLFSSKTFSQVFCGPTTPVFNVNLSSSVNASWTSPMIARSDTCCGAVAPEKCIEFVVTLNPNSTGVIFTITAGSVPPGALYYQVNCGPPTAVGSPFCLSGVGPHYITFCKPGNNSNEYTISSVPNVSVSNTITLNNGCSGLIGVSGMVESSISWTSIFPGPTGTYNSYLSCTSGCDTVTVNAVSGAPPYVDYSVCGLSVDGCSPNPYCDTVRVYFNPTLVANITPVNPVLCFGNPGLTVTANTTGGSAPYTYLWSNGATTQSTYVGPGTYTVTVHDTSNCPPATATVTVTTFTAAITANAGPDQMVCSSSATVQLSGSVTGVTTGTWSGGNGTFSPSNTALNAVYTPSTTEINNGIAILILTTTNNGPCPAALDTMIITINHFTGVIDPLYANVTCFGLNNGSAGVSVAGGTGPYTYSWNTSPVQTTNVVNNLYPGSYTCTITDGNGCLATATFTITQPPLLTISASGFGTSCYGGCNGHAIVNASGGTGNYLYNWQPGGATTSSVNNFCAGAYTVTVTDANNCITSDTANIIQPPPITVSASSSPAYCNQPNGSASSSATGGVGNYSFQWQPGNMMIAAPSNLAPGSYTVSVTDANGCISTQPVSVTQIPMLTSTASVTNVSCNGGTNGSANLAVSGGSPGYTYSWSPSGGSNANATGLTAGNYTCTISDANGCTITQQAALTQPSAITAATSFTGVSCHSGNNGTATVNASGGTGNFGYSWNPYGGNNATANALAAGNYSVSVTDANGCIGTATVAVTEPPAIALNTAGFSASCYGSCNGQGIVIPSGGTGLYTFNWLPGGQTNPVANNLCAGTYTVTVTDGNNCTMSDTAQVNQPSQIVLATSSIASYCNHPTGSANVSASGGAGNYSYAWQPSGQTTSNAINLLPGNYSVTVTDGNGCINSTSVAVNNTPGVTASVGNVIPPLCSNSCDGSIAVNASGGFTPYQYSWNSSSQNSSLIQNLCGGNYTVIVTDAQACTDTIYAQLIPPSPLLFTPSAYPTLCIGQSVTFTGTASGGTPAYAYSWSSGNSTVSPSTTTTYSGYVTDAHGCVSPAQTFTVNVYPALNVAISGNPTLCSNTTTTLSAIAGGGNGGTYNYTWQPGNGTGSSYLIHPSVTTVYTVTATDNCTSPSATSTFTVSVLTPPVAAFTSNDSDGCGHVCAHFLSTTPNTVSTFWTFSDGFNSSQAGFTHCFQQAGIYSGRLIVQDNQGCFDTAYAPGLVTVYANPTADFILGPQPTTILEPDICFTDRSTPDVVSWYWNFDDPNDQVTSTNQNPCHAYSDTGTYCASLIVTNAHQCFSTVTYCLMIEPYYTLYVPNAFTPNEDGLNDVFLPVGDDVDPANYEMSIYDRWGNLIYHTTSWGSGWDGRAKNGANIAQNDTYVWKINLKDHAGQRHSLIGHVSLIK